MNPTSGNPPPSPPHPKRLILVIEDNLSVQEILSRQLVKAGYSVHVADRGGKALEWLKTNKPDLVLLDVMLPEMDGFEICANIRKSHPPNILPIIMLSALGQDVRDRIKGLQAGANDFVAKPYHIDELKARIDMAIASRTG
jgi:DNA-binding response OmpR family regulator